jgi:ATP-binding cassette subfamily B protein
MKLVKLLFSTKKTTLAVFLSIVFLVVQAYCDLNLPKITAKVVDTGIMQGGIEDAVPEYISEKSLENLVLFMGEEDEKTVRGAFSVDGKKSKKLEENGFGDIYQPEKKYRDGEDREKLSKLLRGPMLINFVLENSASEEDGAAKNLFKGENMPEKMPTLEELQGAYKMGIMSKDQLVDMVKEANKQASKMGESVVQTVAVQYLNAEYKALKIDTEKLQLDYMLSIGLTMLAYTLISIIASVLVTFIASIAAANIARRSREQAFNQILDFSNKEMDKFSAASLITRSTNDITQIQMAVIMTIRLALYAPIIAIGGVYMVLQTDTGLGWIVGLAVLTLLIIISIALSVSLPKFKKMQVYIDDVNLVAREMLTGLPVIRAFCRDKYEEKRFDEKNHILTDTQLFTSRLMATLMPLVFLIMNGITVAVVWFGGKAIDLGNLQVGSMMSFIAYSMQIVMGFLMFSMMAIMLPRASVAAERLFEVISTKTSIVDKPDANKYDDKLFSGLIKFKNVNFRFPDAEENVLTNINFEAKPGETTAIIGSTGSGKSTLINLIPRLFDITGGSLTIDGVEVSDMTQHKLRQIMGVVPQKGILFSGDIRSNITFGEATEDAEKTDKEILEIAEIAQAKEFIDQKDGGLNSEISQGGSNVSGGQKQRLSIARAIAKKPKIFIFDDSFSALDYKTDVALRRALFSKLHDTTVIIVAQRISTIIRADKILVLDEGKIVGQGTHKDLLKTCEVYKEIAMSQLSEEELGLK